jgi:hypothetical protein
MKLVEKEYAKYRVIQDQNFVSDFEQEVKKITKPTKSDKKKMKSMQQIQLNIIPFTPVVSKGTFSFYGEKQCGFAKSHCILKKKVIMLCFISFSNTTR